MDCDIAEVVPSSHESVFHKLPPTPTKALNLRSKPLSTPLLGNVAKFHLQQNAQAYVPKVSMRQEVANDIRKIFNARHRAEADIRLNEGIEKYAKSAPSLAQWMENAIPEGLTIFSLPEAFRKRLRTSNMCETLNTQIKRRTKVAGLFPNEASILRLVSAILMDISEEWESGKTYLPQIETH
jgi:transposase-like protein